MGSSRTTPLFVHEGRLLGGKYRVDGVLGSGGMGVVLAATNDALQQRVAVKVLREDAVADAEAVSRFLREGRAAARLRSAHVARVLDSGTTEDGRPFLVLEHLEGRDLSAVVADAAATSVEDAVEYVLQACEAVAEAHANGIVHRDLKPRNLFLTVTPLGRPLVKVLDFGISKLTVEPTDLRLTRSGHILGSPSYMSPEQLRSATHVDARTDVWALGVILYELLTKRVPFAGDNLVDVTARVLSADEVPVHALRPDVPRELSDVVSRCLAKSLDQRLPTAVALAEALAPFARAGNPERTSSPAPPAPPEEELPLPGVEEAARRRMAEATLATRPPPVAVPTPEVSTETTWVERRPSADGAPTRRSDPPPARPSRVGRTLRVMLALALLVTATFALERSVGVRGTPHEAGAPALEAELPTRSPAPPLSSAPPAPSAEVVPSASAARERPRGARPSPGAHPSQALPDRTDRAPLPPDALPETRMGNTGARQATPTDDVSSIERR